MMARELGGTSARVTVEVSVESYRERIEPRIDRVESRVHPREPRVHASRQGIDPRTQVEECSERGRSEEPDRGPDGSVHLPCERSTAL